VGRGSLFHIPTSKNQDKDRDDKVHKPGSKMVTQKMLDLSNSKKTGHDSPAKGGLLLRVN
jgi:hypothetical protein